MPVPSNPFRPADLGAGSMSDLFDAVPTPLLLDHLRFLDHEMVHHPDAYARWWRSKQVSEGRRALVRRGMPPDAWVQTGDR